MRVYAYVRILSDEDTIRSFSQESNVPDASVKKLKAPRITTGDEMLWNWQTPPTVIDAGNIDGGLKELLSKYRPMFPVAQRYKGKDADIYLEIVTQYEKNDDPRGLYLSAETIGLLSELGGAIDIDVEMLGA